MSKLGLTNACVGLALKSRVKREYLSRTSEYLTLPYDNEPASWSTGVLSTHSFSLSTHARRDFLIKN